MQLQTHQLKGSTKVSLFAPDLDLEAMPGSKKEARKIRRLEVEESGYGLRKTLTKVLDDRNKLSRQIENNVRYNHKASRLNKPIDEKFTNFTIMFLKSYLSDYILKYGSIESLFVTRLDNDDDGKAKYSLAAKLTYAEVLIPSWEMLEHCLPKKLDEQLAKASLDSNPLPLLNNRLVERTTTVNRIEGLELPYLDGVYLVEMLDKTNGEKFLKIGYSGKPLERFLDLDNYDVRFLNFIRPVDFDLSVQGLEQKLLNEFKTISFKPARRFDGFTECFKLDGKETILDAFAMQGRSYNKFDDVFFKIF